MVCQFMTGGNCLPGGLGDPAMAVISPIEQAIKRTVFYRNSVDNITMGYLSLVVPTGGLPSLRIDNTNVFSYTAPHPNKAGYTIVVKQWTGTGGPGGTNKGQSIASCDSGFTAVTYGLGSVESYAYNAGTNLENLSALPGYYNTTDTSAINTVHPNGFFNIPMFIGAYFAYKPTAVTWKISALNSVISSPTPPLADITQNNPTPLDSTIIGSAKYYLYRLPGSLLPRQRFFSRDYPAPQATEVQTARTVFEPFRQGPGISLVKARLYTGRMHQIRATALSLGFPVVGDKLYGVDANLYFRFVDDQMTAADWQKLRIDRSALHCAQMSLKHPFTGEPWLLTADLPGDIASIFSL